MAKNSNSVYMAEVTKVLFYDNEKGTTAFMVKPTTWEKAKIRIEGQLDEKPVEGQVFRVEGHVEKEPWMDKETNHQKMSENGNPLYNMVMKNPQIEKAGEEMKIVGQVEKVFFSENEKKCSITLVRPTGWKNTIKVYAPIGVEEGQIMSASGYKETTPAMKDGQQMMTRDGQPMFNIGLRASVAEVETPQEFMGPIKKVLAYYEDSTKATIVFTPEINGKPTEVLTTTMLPSKPEEGDILTISGISKTQDKEKDGVTYTNTYIYGTTASVTPKEAETEGAKESENMNEPKDYPEEDYDGMVEEEEQADDYENAPF